MFLMKLKASKGQGLWEILIFKKKKHEQMDILTIHADMPFGMLSSTSQCI